MPPLKQWLKEKGPEYLLYFSCEMASFARDVKELSEHYQISGPILAMNLNPGTLRLELGSMLQRKNPV